MPVIPGVPVGKATGGSGALLKSSRGAAIVGICALVIAGLAYASRRHLRAGAAVLPVATSTREVSRAESPDAPPPPAPATADSGEIAPIRELAKPWSSTTFTFIRPLTHEGVPAIVVRLPGAAGSVSSYWAFSLTEPFGTCQLVYVTDPRALVSQYGYNSDHPMVADPCTQTVFDPLEMGERTDGAWVRGKIVQGGGLRPPMAIEVKVRDGVLYSGRME